MLIISDDITAWHEFPRSRWMLNKLYVQQKLRNECGPLGVNPPSYPVWVKPVINLHGLGIGSRKVESSHSMKYEPGMMWMPRICQRIGLSLSRIQLTLLSVIKWYRLWNQKECIQSGVLSMQ